MNQDQRIGRVVHNTRSQFGETLAEFGDAIGVTRGHVCNVEQGKHLSLDLALTISEVYGVGIERLMDKDTLTRLKLQLVRSRRRNRNS